MAAVLQALQQAGQDLAYPHRRGAAAGGHDQAALLEVGHPALALQLRRQHAVEHRLQPVEPRGMVLQAGERVAAEKA